MRLVAAALVVAALAVSGAHAAPPSLTVVAEPARVGVGDTFAYVVEARLDASMVDASSVRVFADTGPFAQAGSARTTRSTRGSVLVVRLEQRLTCLDLACAPVQRRRRIPLPAARVVARLAGGVVTARAAPVAVSVEPRVAGAAVHAAAPPYRQQTELPAPMSPAGRLTTLSGSQRRRWGPSRSSSPSSHCARVRSPARTRRSSYERSGSSASQRRDQHPTAGARQDSSRASPGTREHGRSPMPPPTLHGRQRSRSPNAQSSWPSAWKEP